MIFTLVQDSVIVETEPHNNKSESRGAQQREEEPGREGADPGRTTATST